MANPTMTLIASNTVGSGGPTSVTFSSIPQTYTDLVVKTSPTGGGGFLYFNSDSTTVHTAKVLRADGGSASSVTQAIWNYIGFMGYTGTNTNNEWYIPNYTSSNQKSYSIDSVEEGNSGTHYMDMQANLWPSTAAITSITITNGPFTQYSTFYLYGIKNS